MTTNDTTVSYKEEHHYQTFNQNELLKTKFMVNLLEEVKNLKGSNLTVTIIHHTDMDGICAAQLAKEYLLNVIDVPDNRIHCIPYNYEKDAKLNIKEYCNYVIAVDLSLPYDMIKEILSVSKRNLLWIDHHIGSIREVLAHPYSFPHLPTRDLVNIPKFNLEAYLNIDGCGAMNFFNISKDSLCTNGIRFGDLFNESAIFLVDTYDRWQLTPYKPSADALNQLFYASAQLFVDSELIHEILHTYGNQETADATLNKYILTGVQFMEIEKKKNDLRFDKFHKDVTLQTPDGIDHKTCVVWGEGNSSLFGNHISDYEFVTRATKTKEGYSFSFYTVHDDVDCAAIARQYQGSGHRSSSGCMTSYNILDKKWKC